ncbi:MAG: hypothetical protein LBS16_03970 [Prevotellaceae bacterium]|jgi:DMSO/TMAO reductase YedYZ heme-binding membrane subunit|nr:hypothetical protein [Prevotellaceae bacterium]
MIKLLLQLLLFLVDNVQLLTTLFVMTGIFLLLAKSIKKHAALYYILFALPALLFVFREICSLFDWNIISYTRDSILGQIMREYIHVAGFAFPLLIIIMFIGALPAQNPYVKRLMMIRKELSIISGFPIIVHFWVRVRHIGGSFEFFADTDTYMETHRQINSALGAGLTNSAFLLGILMFVLFIILWITSFDVIQKRLGLIRWKKIQRWSYVLYAMLFAHSVLLKVGGLLNAGGGGHGHGGRGGNMTLSLTVGLISTCLIFGTYLVLRLRKQMKQAHRNIE